MRREGRNCERLLTLSWFFSASATTDVRDAPWAMAPWLNIHHISNSWDA